MKKTLCILVFLGMLVTIPAFAADVVFTITIPDAAVPRVAAMIVDDLDCGVLAPKACLKKEIIRYIRYLVKSYEAGLILVEGKMQIDAITDADIE